MYNEFCCCSSKTWHNHISTKFYNISKWNDFAFYYSLAMNLHMKYNHFCIVVVKHNTDSTYVQMHVICFNAFYVHIQIQRMFCEKYFKRKTQREKTTKCSRGIRENTKIKHTSTHVRLYKCTLLYIICTPMKEDRMDGRIHLPLWILEKIVLMTIMR